MSNFPRFDGITLSNNAWIENLYVERMAADPETIQYAGRLWFNTTDNRLSWSAIDPAGGMTIYDLVTPSDLTNILALSKSFTSEQINNAVSNIEANVGALITISTSLINTQALLIRTLSI